MTGSTLHQGEAIPRKEWGGSHWVKRTVAVTFGLGLIATLGVVFTRVIAARVPEQRATLEKLIAQQTGLGGPEVSSLLAQLLPQLVDKVTPNGQVPQANDLQGMLSGLLGSFGK